MYNHKLIFESNMFEDGMTVPANTNADADAGMRVGGQEGRLAVTITAKTSCLIHDEDILTVTLKDCATESGSYAAISPAYSVSITHAADTTYAAGDEIISILVPPGVGKWLKPNIATDDAGATGTMNVFVEYLAV